MRSYKIISVSRRNQFIEVEFHEDDLTYTTTVPFPHHPTTVHDDIMRNWPTKIFTNMRACTQATEEHLNEWINMTVEVSDDELIGLPRVIELSQEIPLVRMGAK